MSLEEFFNIIVDFVSHPSVQAVFACLTILLAFVSCILTYKLSRPRIKIKPIKDSNFEGGYFSGFAYKGTAALAMIQLSFENFSPHTTQIKDIFFTHKRKTYHAADIFTDYSTSDWKLNLTKTGDFPLKQEKFFSYVPFEIGSFQYKKLIFLFYDFPVIDKNLLIKPIYISLAGKRKLKVCGVCFSKSEVNVMDNELIIKKNGVTYRIQSNVPLRYKKGRIIYKKK